MEGEIKAFITVIVMVGILGLAAIANNFFSDYFALRNGLHQAQGIGTSEVMWVK